MMDIHDQATTQEWIDKKAKRGRCEQCGKVRTLTLSVLESDMDVSGGATMIRGWLCEACIRKNEDLADFYTE